MEYLCKDTPFPKQEAYMFNSISLKNFFNDYGLFIIIFAAYIFIDWYQKNYINIDYLFLLSFVSIPSFAVMWIVNKICNTYIEVHKK